LHSQCGSGVIGSRTRLRIWRFTAWGFESLLPHNDQKQPVKAVFDFQGHTGDTISAIFRRMKRPSTPKINKSNPNKYFIYWNHDVPAELWEQYPRRRIRIKKSDDINDRHPDQIDEYAELRRKVWEYNLDVLKFNPFEDELAEFRRLQFEKTEVVQQIEKSAEIIALPEEESRKLTPIDQAFHAFMKSRIARKLKKTSISSYQGTVDWLNQGLTAIGKGGIDIGEIKHIHLSEALDYIAEEREWSATTINKEIDFLLAIFNWLEIEEYVVKNPSKGKFAKLPTNKSKHRWYDPQTKSNVKQELLRSGKSRVYFAMAFTYFTLIRSKQELRSLRIGDIDRKLRRIRFSVELSKNRKEQYRQYPDEFEVILNEMKLSGLPQEWFVFGKGDGTPGPFKCSHNFFSKQFKAVKDSLGLSPDYTIYGMKHTRIVHELMKGTEGKDITHMARHTDYKTTQDYLRDYDLALDYIYDKSDLTF